MGDLAVTKRHMIECGKNHGVNGELNAYNSYKFEEIKLRKLMYLNKIELNEYRFINKSKGRIKQETVFDVLERLKRGIDSIGPNPPESKVLATETDLKSIMNRVRTMFASERIEGTWLSFLRDSISVMHQYGSIAYNLNGRTRDIADDMHAEIHSLILDHDRDVVKTTDGLRAIGRRFYGRKDRENAIGLAIAVLDYLRVKRQLKKLQRAEERTKPIIRQL